MSKTVYEMVANRIIEEMEKGVIPWRKPWTGVRAGAYNRVSRKPYTLLNQMLLKYEGEYATFKQWQELGGRIRKGEKAEFVVFWKVLPVIEEKEDGTKEEKSIPLLRYINVFHISQIEGVEPLEKPFNDLVPIDEADKLINEYVQREKIKYMETTSNKAYYSPGSDSVVVPAREQFPKIEEFYSTAFHELVHSTGHKSRLDRLEKTAFFGSDAYSKEELCAEIGSAAIMNQLGIETAGTFKNSSAYCQSWLKVLKGDPRFVVSAASRADKAVNFIFG